MKVNHPHETQPLKGGAKEAAGGPTKADTAKSEGHRPVLGEGLGASPVVRFYVDGQMKSLSLPVLGSELYRVAGYPRKLTVGGQPVENDNEVVNFPADSVVQVSL